MKKKMIILSGITLATAVTLSSLTFLEKDKLFAFATSNDPVNHQIVFHREDTHTESGDDYTSYFALHKDNATRSGYSIDSTPGECLIMADGDRGSSGSQICFGEANPGSGTYVVLYITIPLTNIQSFTNVVLRGNFYRGYWTDLETELTFGSERYFVDEIFLRIESTYREIRLDEIEINYTCAA